MTIEEQILQKIEKYQKIIIHRHQRPDPDAFGSQYGLALTLKASYPTKEIYQVGKNVTALSWLGLEDEIENDVYQDALVIVTDTANSPRIDDRRYDQGDCLIKIDHHPNDDPYGDLVLVDDKASSCSEIIYDFIQSSNGKLKLTNEAAKVLYAGIIGDTGRFLYDCTSAHTLEVAAKLRAYDFDSVKVCRQLDEISEEIARLSAYVWQSMTITKNNAAYVILTNELLEQFNLKDACTSDVVPLLGKIKKVVCWTVLVEQNDGTYRLRIRSKGPIINELAKEYLGGGHPLASGARLTDQSQIATYLQKLDEIAKNYKGEIDDSKV